MEAFKMFETLYTVSVSEGSESDELLIVLYLGDKFGAAGEEDHDLAKNTI